jgi:hypothetical protein
VKPSGAIHWWRPHDHTVFTETSTITTSTASPAVEEAFGLNELKDRGAITTKTKENIIFIVAALPTEARQRLSYTLQEFVLRCSFNSKDCDMEKLVVI